MDAIIEILPYALGKIIKDTLNAKVQKHEIPLYTDKALKMLSGIAFKELFGYN